jgi:protein SCO1/2
LTRLLAFPLLLTLLTACGSGTEHYAALGVVRDVNLEYGQVLIEHEDIPDLMPAMTMSFDVPDRALLETLARGQAIAFTVAFDGRSYRVVKVDVLAEDAAAEGGELAALAAVRELAPEFSLVDQSGESVSSQTLRGRVLLVDFIYTTCPGPCPILTSRHVSLQRKLSPELRERTRFVSVSLDPERDTPEALRAYAEARGADLAHWSFLTGAPDAVAELVSAYGVGSLLQPDGSINHVVATFLVDAEGRVAERFIGLEHEVEALRRALERLAAG